MKPRQSHGWRGASAVALVMCLGFSTAARADEPAALFEDGANLLTQARELWVEGTSAQNRGQLERARLLYLSAWRAQRHWQIAGSLGHVELALGRHRDAAEHLAIYLRESHDLPNADPRDRLMLTLELERARAKVGTVKVTAEPAGAELLVDGTSLGRAPLADPVFVEPGRHTIEARMEGYQSTTEAREMVPGAAVELRMKLAAAPGAPRGGAGPRLSPVAQSAAPAVFAPRKDWRTSYVPAGTAFGVGGLGLIVGAVTGGVTLSKASNLDALCQQSTRCNTVANRAEQDNARTLGNVSTATFVVGGIGAAAGGVLLGIRQYSLARRAAQRTASWSLDVGPGQFGVQGGF